MSAIWKLVRPVWVYSVEELDVELGLSVLAVFQVQFLIRSLAMFGRVSRGDAV